VSEGLQELLGMGHDLTLHIFVEHKDNCPSKYCCFKEKGEHEAELPAPSEIRPIPSLMDLCCRVIDPIKRPPLVQGFKYDDLKAGLFKITRTANLPMEHEDGVNEEHLFPLKPTLPNTIEWDLGDLPQEVQEYIAAPSWRPCPLSEAKDLVAQQRDLHNKRHKTSNNKRVLQTFRDHVSQKERKFLAVVGAYFGISGGAHASDLSPYGVFDKMDNNAGASGDYSTHDLTRGAIAISTNYFLELLRTAPPEDNAERYAAKVTRRFLRRCLYFINIPGVGFSISFR